jgi:hypothetical protein
MLQFNRSIPFIKIIDHEDYFSSNCFVVGIAAVFSMSEGKDA